jgi:N-acetylmuramoyl-L-alanine amidase/Zinc carboxypeptidase
VVRTRLAILALLLLPGCSATPAVLERAPAAVTIGKSAEGRPIRAVRIGSPRAPVKVLVVGSMHGDEPGGKRVTERLRSASPPRGVALWLIDDLNPDGSAAGRRQNARGVDLNRNFPYRWAPLDGVYESGPRALSEPETRAVVRFAERIRPAVSLWYHQALEMVVRSTGDPALERLYSRRSGLPRRSLPRYHGTAVGWQNARLGGTAFVVELPAGEPDAGRHARAAMALARAVAPPRIVERPIPYGRERRAQMRAYARRHYGFSDYRLRRPRVVVQHYTVTDTFGPVFNTFAANTPDVELGELPGVCAHYVIDRDGSMYRLVPDRIMCRHTVGLNWTAIGIEHVGRSDSQVMGNRRQLAASLRLTRHLQRVHAIRTRDVIGHNESLSSPYHRERVPSLRRQTHGDMTPATMRRYRSLLRSRAQP